LTDRSFARIFFLLVTRLSLNRPFLVFAQICVRQKLERLRLAVAAPGPILGGEPSELDQPRLLARQLQAEHREPVAKVGKEPLGVITMLKARHVVIGEPREDHVPTRVPPPPLVGPQVKDVVEVDVREQRRNRSSLRRALLGL